MEDGRQRVTKPNHRRYRITGLIVTIAYVTLMLTVAIRNEESFRTLRLNEIGDLVAGILGPLALFWLILGFWQQGDELRSSVEALMLQSEELRHSVEQQRALVEVTRSQSEAQIEALRDEKRAYERSLSPRFAFGGDGGTSNETMVQRPLKIINLGASCFDVTLQFYSGYEGESRFAAFPTGHSEVIKLRFHPDELKEHSGSASLKSIYFHLSFSTMGGNFEHWTYGVFIFKEGLSVVEQVNTARIYRGYQPEGYPHPDGMYVPLEGDEASEA